MIHASASRSTQSRAHTAFVDALGEGAAAQEAHSVLKRSASSLVLKLKELRSFSLKSFIHNSVVPGLKSVKGGHLRRNPVCMKNFAKNLGLAWAFQAFGVASYEWSRKKEGLESKDFPFDVFANTAFLIWIQQEVACSQTSGLAQSDATRASISSTKEFLKRAKQIDRKAVTQYLKESARRYRKLLLTIPVGIATYTMFAMGEDQLRRSYEIHAHGASERPKVFSADYLDEFLSHATFIAGFESVLFARMAFVNSPLELKALPALQAHLRSKGLGAVGQVGEWGLYRIPLGLVDGKVLIWWKNKSAEIFTDVDETVVAEELE